MKVSCFACWKRLKEKGGILFAPPQEEYSDNVDIVQKFHLCKKCFPVILDFIMGKESPDYVKGMATLKNEIRRKTKQKIGDK